MKNKSNIFDYIFLLRPSIQVALWTFYFAGVHSGMLIFKTDRMFSYYKYVEISIILFAYSLIMGSVYVLNQIYDIDTDKLNKKLFLLSEGIISIKNAFIYSAVTASAGFAILVFYDKSNINILILSCVSFIMGIMYSVKPFSCKRRPIIDALLNGAGYGIIAPIIGMEASGMHFQANYLFNLIPYLLSMSAIFINTTLMDYDGDKAVGAVTTGVFLGKRKSVILSTVLMIFAFIASIAVNDNLALIASGYSLFFFIFSVVKTTDRSISWSVKYTSPFLALLLGIRFPYFLFLSAVVLISMKIYYAKRFKMGII